MQLEKLKLFRQRAGVLGGIHCRHGIVSRYVLGGLEVHEPMESARVNRGDARAPVLGVDAVDPIGDDLEAESFVPAE